MFLPEAGTRDEPLRTPAWEASLKTGIDFAYFGLESGVRGFGENYGSV